MRDPLLEVISAMVRFESVRLPEEERPSPREEGQSDAPPESSERE